MSDGDCGVTYKIVFEKDHANVKVTYDLSTPVGGPLQIASFQVTVEGTDLISDFSSGQTAFNGVKFHTLAKPGEDATVSFSLTANEGEPAGGVDVLRGDRTFDDAEFAS
jgi:hypothetical protein